MSSIPDCKPKCQNCILKRLYYAFFARCGSQMLPKVCLKLFSAQNMPFIVPWCKCCFLVQAKIECFFCVCGFKCK